MENNDLSSVDLSEWRAQEAPDEFSQDLIKKLAVERRVVSNNWRARGLVIPLLMASLLIAWGAAAAFGGPGSSVFSFIDSPEPKRDLSPEPGLERTSPAAQAPIALDEEEVFEVVDAPQLGRLQAAPSPQERKLIASGRDQESAASGKSKELKPGAVEPEAALKLQTDQVDTRHELHLPRCECGTSGVVCSCFD